MSLTKVTTNGLTDETIDAGKIVDGGLANADIAPGTITSAKLAGSIANAKLANSAITINSSSTALGASIDAGKISWQSVVTGDTTMVAGRGYFVDTSSSAVTMTLPSSAAAGDTIIIKDYAANFGTNSVTIARNSHNIQGVANDQEIKTNRASVTYVYIDSTKGWLVTVESNVGDLIPTFINATGGTVTTSGDFKIHTFTGDGNFVVASVGNCAVEPAANKNKVDYVVVAGGGGGAGNDGNDNGQGGGGAGGFRESPGASTGSYSVSPRGASPAAAITVTATTFPVTVGGGGAGGTAAHDNGTKGSNSVFSTITSTGGGFGSHQEDSGPPGGPGGSGGGGGAGSNPSPSVAGSGNTPPVNPPQGSNGGTGFNAGLASGGGGGGATSAGGSVSPPGVPGGAGGNGATTSITGSAVTYAGGGGGAAAYGGTCKQGAGGPGGGGAAGADNTAAGVAGTANTGGGGGAAGARTAPSQPASPGTVGGAGGSGVVIIRYKFQ
tara:strand:- start:55 stop:1542 length:1488 start_codon:yes stop_codon:yes gene_type:complete